MFEKYGLEASANLFITEQVGAVITPCARGIRLALAEVHQKADRWRDALEELKRVYAADRADPVVRLSLAELMMEEVGGKRAAKQVIRLAEGVDNVSPIHAALLLFKGRALRALGLHTAARDALTDAFRRKKDRPDDLLQAIRYERALVYGELGQRSRARSELEKLYADDPAYEDVATRLNL
jgi:predicted Zn-dependent protease